MNTTLLNTRHLALWPGIDAVALPTQELASCTVPETAFNVMEIAFASQAAGYRTCGELDRNCDDLNGPKFDTINLETNGRYCQIGYSNVDSQTSSCQG
jgi:hypothetical protein